MVMSVLLPLMGKCMLSLALFVVVMYIGVLSSSSRLRQWLNPVRGELSIIACILACGHMAVYLSSYVPRVGQALSGNVLGSLMVALGLLALLLVLGATSFNAVKCRMAADAWKRLQRWSYLFFALVYVHLLLMLAPSAMRGSEAAIASIAVYSVVFLSYAVLRGRRALAARCLSSSPGKGALSSSYDDSDVPPASL